MFCNSHLCAWKLRPGLHAIAKCQHLPRCTHDASAGETLQDRMSRCSLPQSLLACRFEALRTLADFQCCSRQQPKTLTAPSPVRPAPAQPTSFATAALHCIGWTQPPGQTPPSTRCPHGSCSPHPAVFARARQSRRPLRRGLVRRDCGQWSRASTVGHHDERIRTQKLTHRHLPERPVDRCQTQRRADWGIPRTTKPRTA
mmetsp:Transcript_11960/g.30016  ORF Transcript_11960/g.30016 Transcript_11960/m.30016 type:complete len:200 (-) Transcript_11960:8-607(-)